MSRSPERRVREREGSFAVDPPGSSAPARSGKAAGYRQLRHAVRLHLSFAANRARLCRARARTGAGRRSVAVLLLEHLGDVVACEPVARHLKARDPSVFLAWGVKRAYRELIDSNPHIDLTLPLHCLSERLLIARSDLFDQVHDLHFPGRHCTLCRAPLLRERDTPLGLDNYFEHGGILASFSLAAGLPPLEEAPRLFIPPRAAARVDGLGLPGRFVAVCATSNSPGKDWPRGKWLALLAGLHRDLGLTAVEIGLEPVIRGGAGLRSDLCGKLSILESAEVIRRSTLFVGLDSGPAHLANAVGVPGVVLIGAFLGFPRYQPFSGPYANGEGAEIVRAAGPAAEIAVEAVAAAVGRRLARCRTL